MNQVFRRPGHMEWRLLNRCKGFLKKKLTQRVPIRLSCEILETRAVPAFGYPVLQSEIPAGGSVGNANTWMNYNQRLQHKISDDGRYVVMESLATNLVAGITDTNNDFDIFRRDTWTGQTQLVSVALGGTSAGNSGSVYAAISGDGRYVTFESVASNLTAVANNSVRQIYVRDMNAGSTQMVSVNSSGVAGTLESYSPSMSANGNRIAFRSRAANLAGATGGNYHAFVRDRAAGTTAMVSVNNSNVAADTGSDNPQVSANGNVIVFGTSATNLYSAGNPSNYYAVYVRRLDSNFTQAVSVNLAGTALVPSTFVYGVSDDGSKVVFSSTSTSVTSNPDTPNSYDIFVRNINTSVSTLVSVTPGGNAAGVAGEYLFGYISGSGNVVVFGANQTTLVPGVTRTNQIYARNLTTNQTVLVSANLAGTDGGWTDSGTAYASFYDSSAISYDGSKITFSSSFDDLTADDIGYGIYDIFVRDTATSTTTRISRCINPDDEYYTTVSVISPDGTTVALESIGTGFYSGTDVFGSTDVFASFSTPNTLVGFSALPTRTANAVGTVNVILARAIDVSTFTYQDVTLTRNGVNVPLDSSVTVIRLGRDCYVQNLAPFTTADGNYTISIDFTGVQDTGHNPAVGAFNASWTMEAVGPFGLGELVSINAAGNATGTSNSFASGTNSRTVSSDGRYLLFFSRATNLVSGISDTNNGYDLFRRDLSTGQTQLVSISSDGLSTGNVEAITASMSADGRYVFFSTAATNIVTGVSSTFRQIFLRDMQLGTTQCISLSNGGVPANGDCYAWNCSADGRRIVIESYASNLAVGDTNTTADVLVRDVVSNTTFLVSATPSGNAGNGASAGGPQISSDGSTVSFISGATDLVVGPTYSAGKNNVFARKLDLGVTTLVSTRTGAAAANDYVGYHKISGDGNRVAFDSVATNLTTLSDPNNTGSNVGYDVFVRDLTTNTLTLQSVNPAGTSTLNQESRLEALSGDGRVAAFSSRATDTGLSTIVGQQFYGRYVDLNQTVLLSKNLSGNNGGNVGTASGTGWGVFSYYGNMFVFYSSSSDLVSGDSNGFADIFVRNLVTNTTTLISKTGAGQGNGHVEPYVGVSANGSVVAFSTTAANLAPVSDTNGVDDLFVNFGFGPKATLVGPVTPDPRNSDVPFVDIVLSRKVNLATFTNLDLSLTRDGGSNLINGTVSVTYLGGTTYRINNLSAFTATAGVYVLTVNMTGVQDAVGNAGSGSNSDSWVMDLTGPTVSDVVDVAPDPRTVGVDTIDVVLSEPIDLSTFTFADLALTRDGNAVTLSAAQTVALVSGATYRISGLNAVTSTAGQYVLTVIGSGIADLAGNLGSGSANDAWQNLGPPMFVSFSAIDSPRSSSVPYVDVTFSRPIDLNTFTNADITLRRNGGSNLNANLWTEFLSGSTYRINDVGSVTGQGGAYVLTVNMAGIADSGGQAGVGSGSVSWIFDATPPAVTSFQSIASPRNTVVPSVDVTLNKNINLATFNYLDLSLTRNGGSNLINNTVTVSLVTGVTYRINNLTGFTGVTGSYVLTVNMATVQDNGGTAGTQSYSTNWVGDFTPPTASSVGPIVPNPRNTSIDSVVVTLSEVVNPATLDYNDLALTLDGGSNLITNAVTITYLSGNAYQINNLTGLTATGGLYSLSVNMANVQDPAGNPGLGSVSTTWTLDATPPQFNSFAPVSSPRNNSVDSLDFQLSEGVDLSTLDYSDLNLSRDGGGNLIDGSVTVTLVSSFGPATYRINNLGPLTAASGNYVLTINMATVLDAAGNPGSGTYASQWATDTVAPRVAAVYFDGSAWTAAFRAAAGHAAYGYPAQSGAGQLTSLPWSTLNTVYVQFSEDVAVDVADLGVRGLNVPSYAIASFSYDTVTFVAKWVLNSPFDTDRVIVDLDGDGVNAVVDASGNKLAGSWTENVSVFPTTGAAAQDFKYRLVVAVGDADRNGLVRNADVNLVRANLFVDAGAAGYDIYRDIDGNGLTRNADVNTVRSHLFVDPPSGPGPFRPGRNSARNQFGNQRATVGQSGFVANSLHVGTNEPLAHRRLAVHTATSVLDDFFSEV